MTTLGKCIQTIRILSGNVQTKYPNRCVILIVIRSAYAVWTYCILLWVKKLFCKLNLGHIKPELVKAFIAGDEETFLPYLTQSEQELWQRE